MMPTDARVASIRMRMKRPSLLRIWREVDAPKKEKVFALLEEDSRTLSESDPDLAKALLAAVDALEVMATEEPRTSETTTADVEWLLNELERLQAR